MVTVPVGVPPEPVTVNSTLTVSPEIDRSGSSRVILVVEAALTTVTVAWSVIATPPAFAEIVLASATVELKLKVATPLPPVDATAGLKVFPLPDDAGVTETPPTGLLPASRTVTVMVLDPVPTLIVTGEAETLEVDALGAPAVAVALKIAVPTPDTTPLAVLAPGVGPSVQRVLA